MTSNINSVLNLEKCLPNRESFQLNWKILESKHQSKNRREKKKILPLSILVKIKGPPKVLDPYRLTSSPEDVIHLSKTTPNSCTPLDMMTMSKATNSSRPTPERSALPARSPLPQGKTIPGRYFPKPSSDDGKTVTFNFPEPSPRDAKNKVVRKSANSRYDFNKSKAESTNAYNEKIYKTRKSLFDQSKNKNTLFAITFKNQEASIADMNTKNEPQGNGDYFIMKKAVPTYRHVSFPTKEFRDFSDVLKGTVKAIHMKDSVAGVCRSAPLSARGSVGVSVPRVHFDDGSTKKDSGSTRSS